MEHTKYRLFSYMGVISQFMNEFYGFSFTLSVINTDV